MKPTPRAPIRLRREIDTLAAWTRGAPDGTVDPTSALARAEATAHLPTVARVHLALAERRGEQGDSPAVLASCEEGFAIATEGGSDWLALTAASSCLGACANLGRVEEARRWSARVDALSVRLEADRARDRLSHAWTEQYFDADDELVASFEGRLASAYRYVGRYDDAEALFVRMLARPLPHVVRMMTRLNHAQTLADQPTRLTEAYAELELARDELLANGGQGSLNEAHVLAALGQVHHKANRPGDARLALTQARAIYDRLLEPGHIHAQNVDQWLARVDAEDGDAR